VTLVSFLLQTVRGYAMYVFNTVVTFELFELYYLLELYELYYK